MKDEYSAKPYSPQSVHHPEDEDYGADKYPQLFLQMQQDSGEVLQLGKHSTDYTGSAYRNVE